MSKRKFSRRILPVFYAMILFVFAGNAYGQANINEPEPTGPYTTPRVYLDCNGCDYNYIRQEITFVNYVRDQQQSDVHIFVTFVATSGGGREYEVSFIGRRHFRDIRFNLHFNTDRNATSDERRRQMVEVLKMGLAPYMIQTDGFKNFTLLYDHPDDVEVNLQDTHDPWNSWVFELYAGSLNLSMESNRSAFNSRWGIWADRVTEDWKIRFRPYFNYHYEDVRESEEDDLVVSRRHRHGIDSYVIKSLGDHWSAGIFGYYLTQNDRNIRHQFELSPGIEYSFLPYRQATRRAITLRYRIGYINRDYYDITIYDQTSEQLLSHSLRAGVRIQQPWGNVEASVFGSHFFHDTSFRRANVTTNISVRITEGLSLAFYTSFQMIQDQLSLPAGEASLEEILLNQRELATDYNLYTSIAIQYTFGSSFTNVVNTRF